jgi:hypothetical protein
MNSSRHVSDIHNAGDREQANGMKSLNRGSRVVLVLCGTLLVVSCATEIGLRRFAEMSVPTSQQASGMVVEDDGTVVYVQDRLEISVRVLGEEFLNRQFPSQSNSGAESTNPYTYGDWRPWGEDTAPMRFTVLLVKVKNYAYPKVLLDPANMWITTPSGREYSAFEPGLLEDQFNPYLGSYSGHNHRRYREITGILNETLLKPEYVFSGQEGEGYVVFPALHNDVEAYSVHLADLAIRFDYKSDPVETVNLVYSFGRKVYDAVHPRSVDK